MLLDAHDIVALATGAGEHGFAGDDTELLDLFIAVGDHGRALEVELDRVTTAGAGDCGDRLQVLVRFEQGVGRLAGAEHGGCVVLRETLATLRFGFFGHAMGFHELEERDGIDLDGGGDSTLFDFDSADGVGDQLALGNEFSTEFILFGHLDFLHMCCCTTEFEDYCSAMDTEQ